MTPIPFQNNSSDDISAALKIDSAKLRADIMRMSFHGRASHLGSALSCLDILLAAYAGVMRIDPRRPDEPGRDRFILSKGHAAMALYAVLAHRGFFPAAWLDHFNQNGGLVAEQPLPRGVPGVEAATGSLGHGLSLGLGMALAARLTDRDLRVFVLLSDGECNEGAVWEGAMFGAAHQLRNVCAIVDFNRWQATGRSDQIMAIEPLREKWQAFGWDAVEVDGHDLTAIIDELRRPPCAAGRPRAVIAHTIKGKGVSFMEDDNNWHYRIPNADELQAALAELAQNA